MCHRRLKSTQQSDLSVSYFGFVVENFSFAFALKCRAAPFHSPTFFLKAKCKSQEFIFFANKHFFLGFLSPLDITFLKIQIKSDFYEFPQRNFTFIYRHDVMLFSILSKN